MRLRVEGAERICRRLSATQARIAAIAIGGAAGTLVRAGATEALPQRLGKWPWGTFSVNMLGALLLGWTLTRIAERPPRCPYWRPLLGTGFCGALTTFSAFQLETFELARRGNVALAVGYPVASLTAGMAIAVAGVLLARRRRPW